MAGRGPAPKTTRSRARDTAQVKGLPATGELYGRPLPEGVLPKDESWHPQTVAFWDALRANPMMKDEPELGWQFLIDTALMHHKMWMAGRWDFASEVRLRVAKFGATPEDRQRLKVAVTKPAEPAAVQQPAGVTSIRSRRSRLTAKGA